MNQIELLEEERQLIKGINFDLQFNSSGPNFHERLKESAELAQKLTLALLERNAIPQIRLDYLTDPKYNIGTLKSRIEVFESNGTKGKDIFGHGHFLKYLKYLIFGPDLPVSVIDLFKKIVKDDLGTTGDLLEELTRYTRAACRDLRMESGRAAEEFFKLANECGLDDTFSLAIRKAAMSVRMR